MATLTTNVIVCLLTGSGGYADNQCDCVFVDRFGWLR